MWLCQKKHVLQEKRRAFIICPQGAASSGGGQRGLHPGGMCWDTLGTATPAFGCARYDVFTSSKDVRGLGLVLAAPWLKLVPCEVPAKQLPRAVVRAIAF